MVFDPDKYLAETAKVRFKNPQVAGEFNQIDPGLKNVASSLPTPVTITSGKRDPDQNAIVGGKPNSQHLTGGAIDIRKDDLTPEFQAMFKDQGYDVIAEPDHYHIQKSKNHSQQTTSSFDPDSYLKDTESEWKAQQKKMAEEKAGIPQKDENIPEWMQPKPKKSLKKIAEDTIRGVANQPMLRNFSKAATAGISEPLAAGLSTLGIAVADGEDKPIKEIYKQIRKKSKGDLEKINEEHPYQALAGDVAGIAAPGGAFNRISKEVGKAIQIPNISAEATPILARMLQAGIEGSVANAAYQASDVASDRAMGGNRKWTPGKDALVGGVLDAASVPAGEVLGKSYKSLKKAIDSGVLPGRVRGAIESIPGVGGWVKGAREVKEATAAKAHQEALDLFKQSEGARKASHESGVHELMGQFENQEAVRLRKYQQNKEMAEKAYQEARDAFEQAEATKKAMHESGTHELAGQFEKQEATRLGKNQQEKKDAVEGFKDLIKKEPAEAVDQFGKAISSEDRKLSQSYEEMVGDLIKTHGDTPYSAEPIVKEIDKILGSMGGLSKDKIISSEYSSIINTLDSIRKSYREGATLKEIDSLRQQLGDLAKFNKNPADRGRPEKIFGKLYDTVKDHLDDAYSEVIGPKGAEQIAKFKDNFKTKKPLLKKAQSLSKLPVERQVVNMRSKLPASEAMPLIEQFPKTREPMGEMFLNMLTQHSVAPRKFTKEIEYYGRENLKKILGKKTFSALEEAEKRLHEASVPWNKLKGQKPTPLPLKPGEAPQRPKINPFVKAQKPTPLPFKPGLAPQMSKEELHKAYQFLNNFLGNRKGSAKALKYLAPMISQKTADLGEITVNP